MNGHNSRFAKTSGRRRYSRGHLGCMATTRDTRAPRREELVKEEGRVVTGRFAGDYSTKQRAGKGASGIVGACWQMIVDAFTKLFKRKRESSMQERAEESRKKKVDEAEQEFYEQQDRLKAVLRQISGGKK